MSRSFSMILIMCSSLIAIGCGDQSQSVQQFADTPKSMAARVASSSDSPKSAFVTNHSAVEKTLEAAYKDYLAAYDRYVKLLRESGPQTIDTLNALAEYQRKYQIYQMMLSDAAQVR